MRFERCAGRAALLVTLFLLLSGFRCSKPPDTLEVSLLAKDWEGISAAASAWVSNGGSPEQAAILQGYAALARGDAAGGARHFLQARPGVGNKTDTSWVDALTRKNPNHGVVLLLAGDSAIRRGDVRTGLAQLDASVSLDDNLAVARLARGVTRMMAGDQLGALHDLDVIAERSPVAAEARVARAMIYLERGELEMAIQDLNGAIELAPEHAVAHNTRGVAFARKGEWDAAIRDLATAFRLAPELGEARRNWQLAQAAQERGAVTSAQWQIGVFGTGIRSEADLSYAIAHARDLVPGRPHAFVYVGIKGALPLAGAEKMKQQGVSVVVVDPRHPQAGILQVDQFVKQSVSSGKNPIVFIDINKWIPTQLGNNKTAAMTLPAHIAVNANRTFQRTVANLGGQGVSTLAGHSDFTWVATGASIAAAKHGVPFARVILESARSEAAVKEAVRLSPATQFTVIQPIQGDLFTQEAQNRFLAGQPGAYRQTIDTFKNINSPNYRLAIIENPTSSGGLPHLPKAHGDSAQYDRFSRMTFWRGGAQIGTGTGPLGQVIGSMQFGTRPPAPAPASPARGGIVLGPVHLSRGQGGRVVFGSGTQADGELALVSTLFSSDKLNDRPGQSVGR